MQNLSNYQKKEQVTGFLAAIGAYIMWGFLPIYWKLLQITPAMEILAHRMVWSFVFLLCLMFLSRTTTVFFQEVRNLLRQPRQALAVVAGAVLITFNWLTYIWAVNAGHIVETSLGYHINPLLNIFLGIVILKEKPSLWQAVSFILAAIGVLFLTINFGTFPWISLTLALTFGLYALIKKIVRLGAITSITLETLLISPFMFIYLYYVHSGGAGAFANISLLNTILLMGAGVVTATPLLLFATAANRLPMLSFGFLQYIAPILQLMLGVFIYQEPFTRVHLVCFIFIWMALTVFTFSHTKPMMAIEARILGGKDKKNAAGFGSTPHI